MDARIDRRLRSRYLRHMLAAAASQNPVRRNAKMKKNTLSPKSIIAILIAAIIAAVIVVLGVGAALVYMLVLNTPSKQFLMICRSSAVRQII